MKGKLNGATQTRKRGFISALVILLTFIVATFSLGLYFLFRGTHTSNNASQVEIVSAEGKYTDAQKAEIKNSLAKFLGVGEGVEVPEEGTSARLKYDIKLEVAEKAADVFQANKVSAANLSRVAFYLDSVGHFTSSSLLDALTYVEGEEGENEGENGGMVHVDVLTILDDLTEVINYIQNLRNAMHDDLTDDQIINITLDLIGKAFEARENNDDEFKLASNERMAQLIAELEQLKLDYAKKYDAETGSFFYGINEYQPEAGATAKSMFSELNALIELLQSRYSNVEIDIDVLRNEACDTIAGLIYERYINEPQMVHSGVGDLSVTDAESFKADDYEANEILRAWLDATAGNFEGNDEYKAWKEALGENDKKLYKDFLEGFTVTVGEGETQISVTYKGFLDICYQYMNELRDHHLTRERDEAALLSESVRTAQNYVVKQFGKLYNETFKSQLRSFTKATLNLTDAALGLTKILNTTGLKDTINKIATNTDVAVNYHDIEDMLAAYSDSLEAKKVDGKILTVTDEFYESLYEFTDPITNLYATLVITGKTTFANHNDSIKQLTNLIGTVNTVVGAIDELAAEIEIGVNKAYDGLVDLTKTLGEENGPFGALYDSLIAIVHDVQAAQERAAAEAAAAAAAAEAEAQEPAQQDPQDPQQDPQQPGEGEGQQQEEKIEYEFVNLLSRKGKFPLMLIEILNGTVGRDGLDLIAQDYVSLIAQVQAFEAILSAVKNLPLNRPDQLISELPEIVEEIQSEVDDLHDAANDPEDSNTKMINEYLVVLDYLKDLMKEISDKNLDYSTITFKGLILELFTTQTKTFYTIDPSSGFVKTDKERTFYGIVEYVYFGDANSKIIELSDGTLVTLYKNDEDIQDTLAAAAAVYIQNKLGSMIEEKYAMIIEILANGIDLPAEMIDQYTMGYGTEVLQIFKADYDLTNYEFVASWIQELAPDFISGLLQALLSRH